MTNCRVLLPLKCAKVYANYDKFSGNYDILLTNVIVCGIILNGGDYMVDKETAKRALNRGMSIADLKQDQLETYRYNALVKKSNMAIRKAKYSLTLQQQKLLNYLVSQVKDTDTKDTEKVFFIRDFFKFMGLKAEEQSYERVRKDLKALSDKSWWLDGAADDGSDILVRFLGVVRTNKRSGRATIKWHEDMLPFLQHLHREYTQYKLWFTMTMHSEYSARLYELLKSVAGKTVWNFSINELKRLFMCENSYKLFADFKRRVIDTAVKEINEKSDLNVSYELFKFGESGRAYTDIEFTITDKSNDELIKVNRAIKEELERDEIDGQLGIEDMQYPF